MKSHLIKLCLVLSFAMFFASANAEDTSAQSRVTAQDQSTKPIDVEVTRKIRQRLMDKEVSAQAKNVTIVTVNGKVTLKGNVPSDSEKRTVGEIAKSVASSVQNELTVKQ